MSKINLRTLFGSAELRSPETIVAVVAQSFGANGSAEKSIASTFSPNAVPKGLAGSTGSLSPTTPSGLTRTPCKLRSNQG